MKRKHNKYLLIVFVLLFLKSTLAQNLVPNSNFEEYNSCPGFQANLLDPSISGNPRSPKFWFDPTNTSSDYYNACSTMPSFTGVPSNSLGYMNAHSGNAFCGICTYQDGSNVREYIEVKLTEELTAGTIYCCRYWLASSQNTCVHNNNIGLVFSTDSLFGEENQLLNYSTAQVNDQIFTESDVWTEIVFEYTAIGGEKFLTIGVFDNSTFQIEQDCDNFPIAYYFVDDVSLKIDSCSTIQDTIIVDPITPIEPTITNSFDTDKIPNVLTPNNDGINDVWFLQTTDEIGLTILNRWGQIVFQYKGNNPIWDGGNNTEGVYFYSIESQNYNLHGNITIQR